MGEENGNVDGGGSGRPRFPPTTAYVEACVGERVWDDVIEELVYGLVGSPSVELPMPRIEPCRECVCDCGCERESYPCEDDADALDELE